VNAAREETPLVRVAGHVREVAPTHVRVAGLSKHVRLGDRVGIAQDGRTSIGEVVRIDGAAATVKPFDERVQIGIGATAFRMGALSLSPDR
ncbi:hypothetical protein NL425_26375, partial [Klebsiella pneumoniae]|nr:hypothetical protein [Klebsiella pneumoniae]